MQDHEKIEPTAAPMDIPSGAANDEPAPTTGGDLETALRKAEAIAREYYDGWLRAKAEAENARKRAQADVANAHKYALESFSAELLGVRDSLEAALAARNNTVDTLRSGVELTLKQLTAAFEKFAIREINPVGARFDPNLHQAMSMVESDAEPNTVVDVLQKGYTLNDRVVRPALVTIAKARTPA
jgi:molecular chaperone GrpE